MTSSNFHTAICVQMQVWRYIPAQGFVKIQALNDVAAAFQSAKEIEDIRLQHPSPDDQTRESYWGPVNVPYAWVKAGRMVIVSFRLTKFSSQVLSDFLKCLFGLMFISDGFNSQNARRIFGAEFRPYLDRYIFPRTTIYGAGQV